MFRNSYDAADNQQVLASTMYMYIAKIPTYRGQALDRRLGRGPPHYHINTEPLHIPEHIFYTAFTTYKYLYMHILIRHIRASRARR
jgi:hypothetical protein